MREERLRVQQKGEAQIPSRHFRQQSTRQKTPLVVAAADQMFYTSSQYNQPASDFDPSDLALAGAQLGFREHPHTNLLPLNSGNNTKSGLSFALNEKKVF